MSAAIPKTLASKRQMPIGALHWHPDDMGERNYKLAMRTPVLP